jgi:hypothetical protein
MDRFGALLLYSAGGSIAGGPAGAALPYCGGVVVVFVELELLYLRRLVVEHLDSLDRRFQKNMRYYGGSDDPVLKERKIGSLEAEIQVMESIKKKLNLEIGLNELKSDVG